MGRGELKVFANRSGEAFAKRVLEELNKIRDDKISLGSIETRDFANKECLATIKETIRGADVYLIQSCQDLNSKRSIHDNFTELCQTAMGMKQSGANKITAVIPSLPYSRQDRKDGRQVITARWAADVMKVSGINNVITADLHSDQIEGFYGGKIHIDNLRASIIFLKYIKENLYNPKTTVFLAADVGGSKKTQYYAKKFGTREIAQAFKTRPEANEVDSIKIAGYVDRKDLIIIEDMVDTAGTLEKVEKEVKRKGANKITAFCTHPIFSGLAIERLSNLSINVIGTDTIIRNKEFFEQNPWYKEISIAPLFARAIHNLNKDLSISDLYNGTKEQTKLI